MDTPLRGAAPATDVEIERGIRQVHEGELQAGIATLEAALQRPAGTTAARDVALAHVWIGIAHMGLDQLNEARASMRAAVEADRTLTLSPDEFPTQVVLLFQDATAGLAPAPAVTPPAPPAPVKKGHGKAVLIGGAVAATAAGVVVATGGSASPTPRPSPTSVTCTDPAQTALPVFAFPANGATVRGVVSVSCQVPADFPTSCIAFVAYSVLPSCGRTFTLIGQPTAPPYGVIWDSATVPNGVQCLECGLWDTQGRPGPVQHVTVTIAN
jgi:hypothetical protein